MIDAAEAVLAVKAEEEETAVVPLPAAGVVTTIPEEVWIELAVNEPVPAVTP